MGVAGVFTAKIAPAKTAPFAPIFVEWKPATFVPLLVNTSFVLLPRNMKDSAVITLGGSVKPNAQQLKITAVAGLATTDALSIRRKAFPDHLARLTFYSALTLEDLKIKLSDIYTKQAADVVFGDNEKVSVSGVQAVIKARMMTHMSHAAYGVLPDGLSYAPPGANQVAPPEPLATRRIYCIDVANEQGDGDFEEEVRTIVQRTVAAPGSVHVTLHVDYSTHRAGTVFRVVDVWCSDAGKLPPTDVYENALHLFGPVNNDGSDRAGAGASCAPLTPFLVPVPVAPALPAFMDPAGGLPPFMQ